MASELHIDSNKIRTDILYFSTMPSLQIWVRCYTSTLKTVYTNAVAIFSMASWVVFKETAIIFEVNLIYLF